MPGQSHPDAKDQHAEAIDVWLPLCQPPEQELTLEDEWNKVVRNPHERQRCPGDDRHMEVSWNKQRILRNHVHLRPADNHPTDPAEEPKENHAHDERSEPRLTPRRSASPLEKTTEISPYAREQVFVTICEENEFRSNVRLL